MVVGASVGLLCCKNVGASNSSSSLDFFSSVEFTGSVASRLDLSNSTLQNYAYNQIIDASFSTRTILKVL